MIIGYDELIELLMKHAQWDRNDASPREAFAIAFGKRGEHGYRDTIDYDTVDGSTLYLDLTPEGLVKGVEFR